MPKLKQEENRIKKWIDNILIFNVFIIILGAILFILSIFSSANGNEQLYYLFQRLWYPLFIPALSIFFTAILSEVVLSKIKRKNT